MKTTAGGLVAVFMGATMAGWAADGLPSPEAVLRRHVAAVSGTKPLSEIRSVSARLEGAEQGMKLVLEVRAKDHGRCAVEATNPQGIRFLHGCDAAGSWWRQDPMGVRDLKGESAFWLGTTMGFQLADYGDWPGAFAGLQPVEEEWVEGRRFHVVMADWRGITKLRLAFDAESGLLARVGRIGLSDYREVEGVKIPHAIAAGEGTGLAVKEVRFNEAVDEAAFRKPEGKAVGDAGPEVAYVDYLNPGLGVEVARRPPPANFGRGAVDALPSFNPSSPQPFQVDVRGADVSKLDLQDRLTDLLHANFDTQTRWPAALPEGFDPSRLQELGRNPGLQVRQLHRRGLTGKGIGLAVIDQTLLVDHVEYADRLKHYEEIHQMAETTAQMHGPAVLSIAAGRTLGVAPEAELYYIAETHGVFRGGRFDWDFGPLARSIDRMVEINAGLPPNRKIRVISISVGWGPGQKGCEDADAAVKRATAAGVFVISTALERTHQLAFHGLGRDPRLDPEVAANFRPGSWWAPMFYRGNDGVGPARRLLVPMDCRTTAGPCGKEDYVFYSEGGWSWVVPYLAGLYVIACQVEPAITPERFWAEGLRTGTTVTFEHEGKPRELATVVQPVALIDALRKP